MALAANELSPLREVLDLHPVLDYIEHHRGSCVLAAAKQAFHNFDVCATRLIRSLENRRKELIAEVEENCGVYGGLGVSVRTCNDLLSAARRLEEEAIIRHRSAQLSSMDYLETRNTYLL